MKSLTAVVTAAATALILSSCSRPASDVPADHQTPAATSAAARPADVNDADVTFVTGMIPHHEQAVQMSGLVPSRSTNPAVIKLAADISAAQGPEIATMKSFLGKWNAGPVDGHQGMPGMQMEGMVDDATMTKLASLKGNEFDTLWLNSMIGHHDGAIGMATTELAAGANADAKALAQQIITVQQAEIEQMKKMGMLTHDG